ncbi:unnamed protein product [Coregonus sp. 'balchen']|nr:unnamed protein product [Coregonus sp. 'balchen']
MNTTVATNMISHSAQYTCIKSLCVGGLCVEGGGERVLMGDEKDTWKVKTLDEILQEKKRRRELEERTEPKRQKNCVPCPVPQTDDREAKRNTPEEGELRDKKMEITIRNSPYIREDSTEDRGEEDESLAIKPPQQMARKDRSHQRKEEKRKDKRRPAAGKHVRPKDKDRESERRKRQDRLEQVERQRERDRKHREQQQQQKERERRAEERRKEREARREVPSHHRALPDEYGDKPKQSHRSRSPNRAPQDRSEHSSEPCRTGVKDEKPEDKDLLSDLQDISDSERKTSTGESSLGSGSGSGSDDEDNGVEDGSSSQSEGENEESGSGESDQTAGVVSEDEQSQEEFEEERENGNHIPPVPESRFDHDTEESGEEEEEEAGDGDVTPQSVSHSHSATPEPEENYILDSPPISPVELKKELPKYLPALQGCRSVEEFQCLNRIEEGTYGVVYRAKDKKTDEIVALKRLKMEKEKEGFPITSLREINTILKAQHPNIVTVREIVVGSNMDKIYIVMNYVEHDLKSLMETMKQPFLPGEVKTLMIQLLRGVRHLHDNWILHRDLKTSNLLLSHKGILKVGDFGLAREYGSPLKPYTPVVEYSTAVDMWSVGCIFGELLTQKPLFPGKSEIDQINKIFKDLGSPSEKIWPGYNELPAVKKMTFTEYPYNNLRKRFGALLSDQGFDLMNKFLTYCPSKRILSDEALKHEYFRETPQPIDPSMFPTWPAKSEQQRVKRGTSPRPPEGGLGYSQLGDDDLKDSGFHLTTSNQGVSAVGPGFSLKF